MKLLCKSCGSSDFESIIDLGNTPWCNNFLQKNQIRTEAFYPLKLVYCKDCTLLQLTHIIPKEIMFLNHTYVSGTTKTLVDHFYNLAKENIEQFNLVSDDLIIDIGGNDGSQLMQYKKLGYNNVINIESAKNICNISKKNKIPTINCFFNEELIDSWKSDLLDLINHLPLQKPKLINASGVFFHLEEIQSVIRGIKKYLADDGVFIVQFMYAGQIIDNNSFDMIYHEHLYYYTLNSLQNLISPHGLTIFDAYHSDIHSGSIIAKICHKDKGENSFNGIYHITQRCIDTVKKDLDYTLEKFKQIAKDIEYHSWLLEQFLINLNNQGKTVYAYGAPAKGNTLLNYMKIDYNIIKKVVEKNKLKIGLYMPQSYIPIVEESKKDLPDYYLLLAHNFKEEILNNYKEEINSGKVKFIVPFPKLEIISKC